MKDYTFKVQSSILLNCSDVWNIITTMEQVNNELYPFARMTYPINKNHFCKLIETPNKKIFTSWILLFGFLPIDIHFFKLEKLEEGKAFYENSSSIMHKYWKHTRLLIAENKNTILIDEVHFSPRVPLLGAILFPIYKKIFSNRHRQLMQLNK